MIRQFFFASPAHCSFTNSLNDCLGMLKSNFDKHSILGVIFFIDSKSDSEYFERKNHILKTMEDDRLMMPFNVQAQSTKSIVSIEIWINDSADKLEYLTLNHARYTRVTSELGRSIWGIGITSNLEHLPLVKQIDYSFDTVRHILDMEGMTFADIVRQWNYVPNILEIQHFEGKNLQHYQLFNEIRQKYYASNQFVEGYPAATGIGTRNGNFDLDFFALKSNESVQKVGLSNPKQHDAYKYDQNQLIGDATSGQIKKTPLFERAKILKTKEGIQMFISGTASIIGQETIGIGDINCQTEVTVNNIHELISRLNTIQKNHITYLRAYIKEKSHFEDVRSILERQFPDITISYLQADICRDNLLVEIEGAVLVSP